MNEFLNIDFNWSNLFSAIFLLLLIYILLRIAERFLPQLGLGRKYGWKWEEMPSYILLLYEPIVILVVCSVVVLINPVLHGLIMALLLIGGFTHVKNYISGVILRLDNSLRPGKKISVQEKKGIISEMNRLGMKFRTSKGIQHLNYSNLINGGYVLLSGNEVGGYYQLKIQKREIEDEFEVHHFLDWLATVPFLDYNHKPDILSLNAEKGSCELSVLVKEEKHLKHFMALLSEKGFASTIAKR